MTSLKNGGICVDINRYIFVSVSITYCIIIRGNIDVGVGLGGGVDF